LIKTLKKLLSKFFQSGETFWPSSSRNIIFAILVFVIFYLIAPVYLTHKLIPRQSFFVLFIFFFFCILIAVYLVNSSLSRVRVFSLNNQDFDEKINKISYDIAKLEKLKPQLYKKLARYHDLKNMVEALNSEISLEYVVNTLMSICYDVVAEKKGVACVYLVDPVSNKLKLFSAKKENESMVIKAKEGDLFDYWVLKHTQPLLIEDLSKDFRFDLEKLRSESEREISSLVAAPFISEKRTFGLLRLDNPQVNYFDQQDLSFLSTLSDLSAVALENAELYLRTKELAIHDSLTSLYTKGYFMERLKEEFQRSIRDGLSLSILMLDIDLFKTYNDKYGHLAGDIILKNISLLMSEFFEGKNSIICRFGGEEFIVLSPNIDKKKALEWAEGLRQEIEKRKFMIRRKETQITVSIGVASATNQTADEDELLKKVDAVLYEAKQKGRNRVCHT